MAFDAFRCTLGLVGEVEVHLGRHGGSVLITTLAAWFVSCFGGFFFHHLYGLRIEDFIHPVFVMFIEGTFIAEPCGTCFIIP